MHWGSLGSPSLSPCPSPDDSLSYLTRRFKAPAGEIVFKYLDMITVAVPPALAACLTIATTVAIGRLNGKLVFVSNPNVINMAGLLDTVCFDKTGTLTEAGLDLLGMVPVDRCSDTGGPSSRPVFEGLVTSMEGLRPEYQELCALCHGLARLGEQVVGDPLDQRLFAATRWVMEEEEAEHEYEAEVDADSPKASGGVLGGLAALVSSAIQRNADELEASDKTQPLPACFPYLPALPACLLCLPACFRCPPACPPAGSPPLSAIPFLLLLTPSPLTRGAGPGRGRATRRRWLSGRLGRLARVWGLCGLPPAAGGQLPGGGGVGGGRPRARIPRAGALEPTHCDCHVTTGPARDQQLGPERC